MNEIERQNFIAEQIKTSTGRLELARSMSRPLEGAMFHFCMVCRKLHERYSISRKVLLINGIRAEDPPLEFYDKDLNKTDRSSGCYVCSECAADTKERLKKLKFSPLEDLPLFIHDSNIFIREKARELVANEIHHC